MPSCPASGVGGGHHLIVLRAEDTLVLATVQGAAAIEALVALDDDLRALMDLSDTERFQHLVRSGTLSYAATSDID